MESKNGIAFQTDLSTADLATALGVRESLVAGWLAGARMPRRRHIAALAEVLGQPETEVYQKIRTVRGPRQPRRAKDGRQSEIAKKLGVTQVTISRWLCGVYMPSYDDLERLAEAMGRDSTELLLEMKAARRNRTKKIT